MMKNRLIDDRSLNKQWGCFFAVVFTLEGGMGLMCEIDEGKKLCATREHHNYLKHAMREF